jgi:apolipoprotein N-acyltransferase
LIANTILAVISAALLIIIQPEYDVRWLVPLALVPLLLAAGREPTATRRFLLGALTGVITWFGICYWIRYVLVHHGGMTDGLSWLAMFFFCLSKGFYVAVFALLAGPLLRLRWFAAPVIAGLWAGLERTQGPMGFAWLTLGNAGIDMELPMRLAPVVGTYGLSFVFALLSASMVLAIHRRPRRELIWPLALPLLFLLPALPPPARGTESAVTMQPNLAQRDDWKPAEVRAMHDRLVLLTLEEALKQPKPKLLLWPEVPAPIYYYNDARFREHVTRLARVSQAPFLFGSVSFTLMQAPLNSAILIDPAGNFVSRYDKMFLVPFGEYIPPLFNWVNRITNEAGDFEPGKNLVVSKTNGYSLGTFICYESAFPHLVRLFPEAGADVLLNITNDGYFGRTSARAQHLLLGRMRAAENRRWVLRSTNDGWTVSIDPAGRIVDSLPPFEERAGRLSFTPIRETTLYSRYGDWFAWLGLIIGFVATPFALFPPGLRSDREKKL